ncbi:hypothetical protein MHB42_02500 [Lysinibacillus sp. FSL K6-0232]|uniref:hypothetical protein n=1 Tax=unclassified Lysinibacillus TaxID=2636778 RepID=UPI0030FAFC88
MGDNRAEAAVKHAIGEGGEMMFVKQREKSCKLLVLEALERRLPKNHASYEYFQEMLR